MRIAFSKYEVELIYNALRTHSFDIENRRSTYEMSSAPFTKEKCQEYIDACNEELKVRCRLMNRMDKKLREWKQ